MSRRCTLALALAVAVSLTVSAPRRARAQSSDETVIESSKLADGIYMLKGRGGNIGVSAGDDGAFLIDDQFAPLTDKIVAAVAKLTDQPIRFVINTHFHGDHTGGNENLGQAGVVIVAHDNVRARLATEQILGPERRTAAQPADALPVVTFNDTVTLHLNGHEIHAFHVSHAHTDGDSLIVFRDANVIHMGDIYFNGLYPFIDVAAGGSVGGVIEAVDRALEHTDGETRIIPGHGPPSGRQELVQYREMLQAVRDRVAPMVAAGKSLQDVQAAKPSADFDERWGKGFLSPDRFVASIYDSLSKR